MTSLFTRWTPLGPALLLCLSAAACGGNVPVLMYHSIDAGSRDPLAVEPALFEEHLQYLEQHGYTTITLQRLVDHLEKSAPLPSKPVVLTFDDGYRDAVTQALPALQRHGMVGTFFLCSGLLAEHEAARKKAGGHEVMTWAEARALAEAGMEIGSHTVSHRMLTKLAPNHARAELEDSRRELRARLGRPIDFFSYPFTRGRGLEKAVKRAGYLGAVSGPHGSADPFDLQRVTIFGRTSVAQLAGQLAQDWSAGYVEGGR